MKKYLPLITILIFLILASFLRFYRLADTPPSLNWDEISHGYNAYSILKTGQDEWGVSWPTIFRAYGDYKLPAYIYLTVLSEAILGLNSFAVRLPSVLAGIASVLFTYLLVKKLFKNELISLLSAGFLAISPWHFFLSRPALEANLASFLVIAGIYFFLAGFERRWFLPLSVLLLGLSVHTYNSARIFTPLLFVVLLWLKSKKVSDWIKKRRTETILVVILLLLFFVPLIFSFISSEGRARFRWVTIIDEGAINRINWNRGSSNLPQPLPRLIHNKVTYFITGFAGNYLSNFSPNYLFFRGGSHYQFSIPGKGIIYPIQIPVILLGIFWLLRNWKEKEARLVACWWLLAVVPSAATRDNPHVLRTILVLPAPQILVAIGIWQFWKWKTPRSLKKGLLVVYLLALSFFACQYLINYFGPYRQTYSWSWQYGYQQAAEYIKTHYDDYEKILMTKKYGEPHEFLLFYLHWDPEKYRSDPNLNRYFRTDWYWVDSFDKFVFINDWEIEEKGECRIEHRKCLLITSPGNYSEGWGKIETINFLDGKPAFEILER